MKICIACGKEGAEDVSRCGHILHKNCLEGTFRPIGKCPSCKIIFSEHADVEQFLSKIKLFYSDPDEAEELLYCAEYFVFLSSKDEYYDENILEKVLRMGWDINDVRFGGPDLFYQACKTDDLLKVNLLIENGLDLDKYGEIGLDYACSYSSYDVVQRLLQIGVKPGNDTIFLAISKNRYEMLEILVKEGVDVNLKGEKGITPIHAAAKVGSIKMVKLLKDEGADFKALDDRDDSILHYACHSPGESDLLQFLIDSGIDFKIRNKEGSTPLLHAIKNRNWLAAKVLIRNKVDINDWDCYGDTPLHFCANKDDYDLLKFLVLECRADVNARNDRGRTPIFNVCKGKNFNESINLLLDNGANINIYDNDRMQPFVFLYNFIDDEVMIRFINGGSNLMLRGFYVNHRNILEGLLERLHLEHPK